MAWVKAIGRIDTRSMETKLDSSPRLDPVLRTLRDSAACLDGRRPGSLPDRLQYPAWDLKRDVIVEFRGSLGPFLLVWHANVVYDTQV